MYYGSAYTIMACRSASTTHYILQSMLSSHAANIEDLSLSMLPEDTFAYRSAQHGLVCLVIV